MSRVVLLLCLTACATEYSVTNAPPTMFPGGWQEPVDPTRAGLLGELSEAGGDPEILTEDPPDNDPPLGSTDTPPDRPHDEAGFLADAAAPEGDDDPDDEEPVGDDPEEPQGEDPLGEDPLGEEPPAEEPPGEEPPGEDPLGEDPPDGGGMTPGRMTGQVGMPGGAKVHAHVYCDVGWPPGLRIDVDEGEFVLATLDSVSCWDDPGFDSESNQTDFDTLIGEGTGTLDGVPATVWFSVSDGGESGENDHAAFQITVGGVVIAADSAARNGNLQAHPPVGGTP